VSDNDVFIFDVNNLELNDNKDVYYNIWIVNIYLNDKMNGVING
jgi:hypothetical protein